MASTSRGSAGRRAKGGFASSCGRFCSSPAPASRNGRDARAARRRAPTARAAARLQCGACPALVLTAAPRGAQPLRRRRAACAITSSTGATRPLDRRPPAARDAARLDGRRRVVPVRRRRARRGAPRARARLARLRRQRHAGRPTPTGSPTTSATSSSCSTRCSAPARADRPARPQHGRQRGDALRRHAARSACAGSSTSKASACRARSRRRRRSASRKWLDELKHAAGAAPATPSLDAVAARLHEDQPAAARRPRRLARVALVAAARRRRRRPRALLGRPDAQARQPAALPQVDEWLECWKRITAPRALGRGRPHRHRAAGGATATRKAEFHERLDVVADVERHVVAPGRPHAAPRPARGHRPADRGVPVRIAPSAKRLELKNDRTMDVEHINAIGNRLADLTKRTERPPGVSLTTTAKRCA